MEIVKARIVRNEEGEIYLDDETLGYRHPDDFLSDIAGRIEEGYTAIEIRYKKR